MLRRQVEALARRIIKVDPARQLIESRSSSPTMNIGPIRHKYGVPYTEPCVGFAAFASIQELIERPLLLLDPVLAGKSLAFLRPYSSRNC